MSAAAHAASPLCKKQMRPPPHSTHPFNGVSSLLICSNTPSNTPASTWWQLVGSWCSSPRTDTTHRPMPVSNTCTPATSVSMRTNRHAPGSSSPSVPLAAISRSDADSSGTSCWYSAASVVLASTLLDTVTHCLRGRGKAGRNSGRPSNGSRGDMNSELMATMASTRGKNTAVAMATLRAAWSCQGHNVVTPVRHGPCAG